MTEVARVAIVTGGGDCPGMNAVIRAVAKAARLRGWETIGVTGGFDGLFDPRACHVLDYQDLYGLLTKGGSILGSANSGRFAAKVGGGEVRQLPEGLLSSTKEAVERLGLSGLVVIGGDGTMSIALQLDAYGIPVVGVPKTIDNDLGATLQTFGFDSAVAYATDAVDRLQTTAESHRRAIVLEVMGRHAGWIALYSALAGGADIILIPEIPFTHEHIAEAVRERDRTHRFHTIVVAAEGARLKGSDSASSVGGGSRSRGTPGRHRAGGGGGDRAPHRQGDALRRARPPAAWWQPHALRPRPVHGAGSQGGGAGGREGVRPARHLHRPWHG